mgnify:CR=1 FL=1
MIARTGGFVYVCMDRVAYDKCGGQRDWIPEPPEPEREKDQKEANANPKKR